MRILHVLETLAAGGVETTFLNVLRHLSRRGTTHDVLAFHGGALADEYRRHADRVYVERSTASLEQLVTAGCYDVAYILFERCAERLLPILLTRTATRAVYGKNYDFSGQWRSTEGFVSHADAAMLAACDGVTFTTQALAESYGPAAAARGLVLGKGADVSAFMALPPAPPDTSNRILVVANPTPRKRLGDLIAALVSVRHHVADAHVRILGAGDVHEVARLQALASELGVAAHVDLAGGTRDVAGEMSRARVLALSSGSEGVPTAVLEAMAAARPVVVTDAGHVRTIVNEGVEGFVVPVGDVAAIAERLTRLLTDRSLAATMGLRGRNRAARHGVEAIAARLSAHLARAARAPCH